MTFSRLHLRSVCGHLLNNYNIEVMFRFLTGSCNLDQICWPDFTAVCKIYIIRTSELCVTY